MTNQSRPVLVIGSLNMDLVLTVERLPVTGETILGNSFATYPGGKGANQAVAAARLGAKVYMTGCLGQDAFAGELLTSLKGDRVDTTFVRQVTDPTGLALITVDRLGANTIVVTPGANLRCVASDVDRALNSINDPGVLLVQHEIPTDTVEHAVKEANSRGWTMIVNPAPARPLSSETLALIDIIAPNETEAAILSGLPVRSTEEAVLAAQEITRRGAKTVIVTLGERGAVGCNGTGYWHIPACSVPVVDTTAAGDAYIGALAVGFSEGLALRDCMLFAANAASISVTRNGAQPSLPWRHELNKPQD